MIIQNTAFILDFLTNKLSISTAFEKNKCSKWTNSMGKVIFGITFDRYNPKLIWIIITWSILLKKSIFYNLIEK